MIPDRFSPYSGDSRIETFRNLSTVSALSRTLKAFSPNWMSTNDTPATNLHATLPFGEAITEIVTVDGITVGPKHVFTLPSGDTIDIRLWTVDQAGSIFIAWSNEDRYSPYGILSIDGSKILLDTPLRTKDGLVYSLDIGVDCQEVLAESLSRFMPRGVPVYDGPVEGILGSETANKLSVLSEIGDITVGGTYQVRVEGHWIRVQPWRPARSNAVYLAWQTSKNAEEDAGSAFGWLSGSTIMLGPRDASTPFLNGVEAVRLEGDAETLQDAVRDLRTDSLTDSISIAPNQQ